MHSFAPYQPQTFSQAMEIPQLQAFSTIGSMLPVTNMDNNNAYTSYENVSNTAKSDQELASNSSKNMNIANLSNDLPSSNINEPVDKLKVAPRIDMKPSSIKSVPQKQIGLEVLPHSKLISRQAGGTDVVYQCPYCTKAPKGFDDLKLHMTLAHNTKKILSCSHCNYQTLIEQNLISHKSEKHPDISKVSCPSCNYQTFGKVGLSRHKCRSPV